MSMCVPLTTYGEARQFTTSEEGRRPHSHRCVVGRKSVQATVLLINMSTCAKAQLVDRGGGLHVDVRPDGDVWGGATFCSVRRREGAHTFIACVGS